jgi:hypothetical protein
MNTDGWQAASMHALLLAQELLLLLVVCMHCCSKPTQLASSYVHTHCC